MKTKKPADSSSIPGSSTRKSVSGTGTRKGTSAAINIPGSSTLKSISNRQLLSSIRKLSETERRTVLSILVHLVEIDCRKLYLPMGYSSLFELCVKDLGYSESVAGRRISVARCIREFPRACRALASGKVNLTNLDMITGIITEENEKDLLSRIAGAAKKDVELLVSRHKPGSVIRDRVRPVYVRTEIMLSSAQMAGNSKNRMPESLDGRAGTTPTSGSGKSPNSSDASSGSGPAAVTDNGSKPAATVVLEEMFELKFGVAHEFLEKIERVRSLLSSKHHRKLEFEELFAIMMDEYIERHSPEGRISRKTERERRKAELEKGKATRTASKASRKPKNAPGCSASNPQKKESSRYIPQKVRDEVYARDKGRCAFVSPGGRKCGSKWELQIDHVVPFARGGDSSPSNLRLLCAKHNRLEAERAYGKRHMEQFKKS